jgi:hypothetical protein
VPGFISDLDPELSTIIGGPITSGDIRENASGIFSGFLPARQLLAFLIAGEMLTVVDVEKEATHILHRSRQGKDQSRDGVAGGQWSAQYGIARTHAAALARAGAMRPSGFMKEQTRPRSGGAFSMPRRAAR